MRPITPSSSSTPAHLRAAAALLASAILRRRARAWAADAEREKDLRDPSNRVFIGTPKSKTRDGA